jgi:hypothetical protein
LVHLLQSLHLICVDPQKQNKTTDRLTQAARDNQAGPFCLAIRQSPVAWLGGGGCCLRQSAAAAVDGRRRRRHAAASGQQCYKHRNPINPFSLYLFSSSKRLSKTSEVFSFGPGLPNRVWPLTSTQPF